MNKLIASGTRSSCRPGAKDAANFRGRVRVALQRTAGPSLDRAAPLREHCERLGHGACFVEAESSQDVQSNARRVSTRVP